MSWCFLRVESVGLGILFLFSVINITAKTDADFLVHDLCASVLK